MMIESIILKYLKGILDVPIFLENPNESPPKYILFEKTGSGKSNHLHSSTFAFQSYATSMVEASRLNITVIAAVESLVTLDYIAGVKLNSDYNFTDTNTKQYRYQAVFDIKHY